MGVMGASRHRGAQSPRARRTLHKSMHDRRSTMRYAGSAAWTRDTMLCSLPPHGRPTNQCVKRGETRLWAQPSRGREVEHLNKSNGSQPYQITDGMGQIGVTQCYIVHIGFTVEFYSIVQIVVGRDVRRTNSVVGIAKCR